MTTAKGQSVGLAAQYQCLPCRDNNHIKNHAKIVFPLLNRMSGSSTKLIACRRASLSFESGLAALENKDFIVAKICRCFANVPDTMSETIRSTLTSTVAVRLTLTSHHGNHQQETLTTIATKATYTVTKAESPHVTTRHVVIFYVQPLARLRPRLAARHVTSRTALLGSVGASVHAHCTPRPVDLPVNRCPISSPL